MNVAMRIGVWLIRLLYVVLAAVYRYCGRMEVKRQVRFERFCADMHTAETARVHKWTEDMNAFQNFLTRIDMRANVPEEPKAGWLHSNVVKVVLGLWVISLVVWSLWWVVQWYMA